MSLKINKYISLLIWIFSLIVIGAIIGILNKSYVYSWYMTLNRSPITPPNYLFGIVWSTLYSMIGTSGWIIWGSHQFKDLKLIKKLYLLQLFLNWSWTFLFFRYHLTGLSLVCLSMIIILVAGIVIKSYKKINIVTLLFLPYLIWLLLAFHLNLYIWVYN